MYTPVPQSTVIPIGLRPKGSRVATTRLAVPRSLRAKLVRDDDREPGRARNSATRAKAIARARLVPSLHGTRSTVITATSEQRLAAAVNRFIESSRQHGGK